MGACCRGVVRASRDEFFYLRQVPQLLAGGDALKRPARHVLVGLQDGTGDFVGRPRAALAVGAAVPRVAAAAAGAQDDARRALARPAGGASSVGIRNIALNIRLVKIATARARSLLPRLVRMRNRKGVKSTSAEEMTRVGGAQREV